MNDNEDDHMTTGLMNSGRLCRTSCWQSAPVPLSQGLLELFTDWGRDETRTSRHDC